MIDPPQWEIDLKRNNALRAKLKQLMVAMERKLVKLDTYANMNVEYHDRCNKFSLAWKKERLHYKDSVDTEYRNVRANSDAFSARQLVQVSCMLSHLHHMMVANCETRELELAIKNFRYNLKD